MIVQWPCDHPRYPTQSYLGAQTSSFEFPWSDPGLARSEVLAVFMALAYRYTGQADIAMQCLDLPTVAAPQHVQAAVEGDATLSALTHQVGQQLNTGLARNGHDNPACNSAVIFDTVVSDPSVLARLLAAAAYDLAVQITRADASGRATLCLHYNAALFDASNAEDLLVSLQAWLSPERVRGGAVIDALPLLSEAARAAQEQFCDSGTADYPQQALLQLIEAHAKAYPQHIAAQHGSTLLCYGELLARSDALAQHFLQRGLGPGSYVAVCVKPGFEVLVGLLATFRIGGIYVPLDPGHPEAYVQNMVDEVKPAIILAQTRLYCFGAYPVMMLPAGLEDLPPAASDVIWPQVDLDHPAYIFYTSGTTGRPKGVLASQRNLLLYVHSAQHVFRFVPGDIFTSIARYTFSISFFDLLTPLSVGARVRLLDREEILAPERFVAALREVTVSHIGPSLLGSLFRYLRAQPGGPVTLHGLRHVSSGGDIVSASVMEDMKHFFPNAELFVIYGCTEISCMGTVFPISRSERMTHSFVGRAFPEVTVRVVDAQLRPVPYGVVGELCFAGQGLSLGYLHRPELVAEKFVDLDGQRFYRMGDMGRLHRSGNIEMLGRRDFQIQLRGMRIELAGIENTVRDLGLAAQCALVLQKKADDERLIAFVVAPRDREIAAFRRALSTRLPDHMLPQHLVVLAQMPLTTNGKLDRHALQALPWEVHSQTGDLRAPQNEIETQLLGIFQRVLSREQISTDQNFFDLGGHSLLAVVALHEIEQVTGRELSAQTFFEDASIVALAQHIASAKVAEDRPILLNEHRGKRALFMLSGIHCYRPLAARLQGRWAVYGVFARNELNPGASGQTFSVADIARNYIEIIRREQAHGPYALLGYSFSGLVAYEVAQQLRQAGEEVDMLILLDAFLPEWTQSGQFRREQWRRLRRVAPGDLLRYAWRRMRERWAPDRGAIIRYDNEGRVGQLEAQRSDVNTANAARYLADIQPYDGRCLLITSHHRLRHDPLKSRSGGWRPYMAALEVVSVDADHFKMIEDEPDVSRVADYIDGFSRAGVASMNP